MGDGATRIQIFCTAGESEAYLVRVFTGDTCCNDMAPRGGGSRQALKVNGGVSPGLDAIKHPDVFDPLKRYTHSNLTGDKGYFTTQVYALELDMKRTLRDRFTASDKLGKQHIVAYTLIMIVFASNDSDTFPKNTFLADRGVAWKKKKKKKDPHP